MKILFTKPFIKDYQFLPAKLQKLTDKHLELLFSNPQHPSLRIKKMEDPREIWEGRISYSYRFTFQKVEDTYILRRIGSHDILKHP
ncbi:MAG: hypothetical protein HZA78_05020 [Candidatus Schekmanbacteria bacterium]|nr:hypothetical protein [Candidatus Schekmanbacteria bacterium]